MAILSFKHAFFAALVSVPFATSIGCAVTPDGDGTESSSATSSAIDDTNPPLDGNQGGVGTTCGGLLGLVCRPGLYCQFDENASCGRGNQTGTCARRPRICNHLYLPVCGCNGVTYANACHAAAAGVSVEHTGECNPPPAGGVGDVCGTLLGKVCKPGLYCLFEESASCGRADQGGTCAQRPDFCTDEYLPVCGCNDVTYSNACVAATAGVSVAHDGACEAPQK